MTFKEHYEEAKKQQRYTPANVFIQGIMDVTKKSEASVRRWLSGSCAPDALTRDVLAEHFNTTTDELFKDFDS